MTQVKKRTERLTDYGVFLPGAPKDRSKSLSQLLLQDIDIEDDLLGGGAQQSIEGIDEGISIDPATSRMLPGFEELPHGRFMTGLFNNLLDSVNLDAESVMDSIQACSMLSINDPGFSASADDPKLSPESRKDNPFIAAKHTLVWLEKLEKNKDRDFPFSQPQLEFLKIDLLGSSDASLPEIARFHRATLQDWSKSIKKDLLWPKPDMEKLIADGVPASLLLSMKNLRDGLQPSTPIMTIPSILSYAHLVLSSKQAFDDLINNFEGQMTRLGVDLKEEEGQLVSNLLLSNGSKLPLYFSESAYPLYYSADPADKYQSFKDFTSILQRLKTTYDEKKLHFQTHESEKRRHPLVLVGITADSQFYNDLGDAFEGAHQAADAYRKITEKVMYGISLTPNSAKTFERAHNKAWQIYTKLRSASDKRKHRNEIVFEFSKKETESWRGLFTSSRPLNDEYAVPFKMPVIDGSVLGVKEKKPEKTIDDNDSADADAEDTNDEAVSDEQNVDNEQKKKPRVFRIQRESLAITDNSGWDGREPTSAEQLSREDFSVLSKTLGARGFQVGNWLSNQETRDVARLTYNAFEDLSEVINWPIERLGMGVNTAQLHSEQGSPLVDEPYEPGDSLGLAFGARGKGRAAAHYESGLHVINLTRTSGAGSLAHELGHALDAWMLNFFDVSRNETFNKEFGFFTGRKGDSHIHFASEILFMDAISIAQKGLSAQMNMANQLTNKISALLKPEFIDTGRPIAQALAQWTTNLFITQTTLEEREKQLYDNAVELLASVFIQNDVNTSVGAIFDEGTLNQLLIGDDDKISTRFLRAISEDVNGYGVRGASGASYQSIEEVLVGEELAIAKRIADEAANLMTILNPDILNSFKEFKTENPDFTYTNASYYRQEVPIITELKQSLFLAEKKKDYKALAASLLADPSAEGVKNALEKLVQVFTLSKELNEHLNNPTCLIVKSDLIKNPPSFNPSDLRGRKDWYKPGDYYMQSQATGILNDLEKIKMPEMSSEKMGYSGQIPHPKTLSSLKAVHEAIIDWSKLVGDKYGVEKPEGMSKYDFIPHLVTTLIDKGINISPSYDHGEFPLVDMPSVQQNLAKHEALSSSNGRRMNSFMRDHTEALSNDFSFYEVYSRKLNSIEEAIQKHKNELIEKHKDNAEISGRVALIDDKTVEEWVNLLTEHSIKNNLNYLDGYDIKLPYHFENIAEALGLDVANAIKGNKQAHDNLSLANTVASKRYRAVTLPNNENQATIKSNSAIKVMKHIDTAYASFRYMDNEERVESLNGLLPTQMQDFIQEKGVLPFFKASEPSDKTAKSLDHSLTLQIKDRALIDSSIDYNSSTFLSAYNLMADLSRTEYLSDYLNDNKGINLDHMDLQRLATGNTLNLSKAKQYKPSGLLSRSLERGGMAFNGDNYAFRCESRSAKTYWSHPTELFARNFESLVYDQLNELGKHNHFLVTGTVGDMYANGTEREKLNSTMLNLINASGPEFDRLNERTIQQRQAKLEKENLATTIDVTPAQGSRYSHG